MEIIDRMPWAAQYAVFQKLAEICEAAALTPKERESYEESIKVYRDNIAIAQRADAKGRAEGERKKQYEIALKMKENGMDAAIISQFTGLDIDEINNIDANANKQI